MATIPDPKKQEWIGLVKGPFNGDIAQSFNIDLETQKGRLLISDRMESRSVLTPESTWGTNVLAFEFNNLNSGGSTTTVYALTDKLLLASNSWTDFTFFHEGSTNSPAGGLDMLAYQTAGSSPVRRLLVVTTSDIYMLANGSGSWNTSWFSGLVTAQGGGTPFLSGVDHSMAYLSNLIIITDGPYIHTVDNNDIAVWRRISFNSKYYFHLSYAGSDVVWLGFHTALGQSLTAGVEYFGGGMAYWDGGNEVINESYFFEYAPMTGFIVNNIPYFIMQNGVIMEYNSSGFAEVQTFPNYEENIHFAWGAMGKHSCTVENNLVYINVMAPAGSRRMKSGVWVYNTTTGNLYHRWSYGQYIASGDQDFGQSTIQAAGAITLTHESQHILTGGSIYSVYPGTTKLVFASILPNTVNRGYFTTPLIASASIEDLWYNLWIRFPQLRTSSSLINVKWRVGDPLVNSTFLPVDVTITWTGATTFTAVLPVIIPSPISVGNEVEITAGDNAGCCFHILSMSAVPDGSSTITVTIDESTPVTSSNAALARIDNWVKITNNNPLMYSSATGTNTSHMTTASANTAGGPYVEFKIELRGTLTAIDQLRIDSIPTIEPNL